MMIEVTPEECARYREDVSAVRNMLQQNKAFTRLWWVMGDQHTTSRLRGALLRPDDDTYLLLAIGEIAERSKEGPRVYIPVEPATLTREKFTYIMEGLQRWKRIKVGHIESTVELRDRKMGNTAH
jgi:hypothetical protein